MEIPDDVWKKAEKSLLKTHTLHACEICNGAMERPEVHMDEAWGFFLKVKFLCGYIRCYPGCHKCTHRMKAPNHNKRWCRFSFDFVQNCKNYEEGGI